MHLGQNELVDVPPGTPTTASPSWMDYLTSAVPAAVQLYRERQATKMQMERARQGLPPLSIEQYSPAMRVQVSGGMDEKTQKVLMLAGVAALGLGAVLLMGRRRRG